MTDRNIRNIGDANRSIYAAPMEGITTHVYRKLHCEMFSGIDKYFTPFLSPNQNQKFSTRELKDILPENNEGVPVVPQILTNKADYFVGTANRLQREFGYEEINLNLGCPSGTVTAKGKGAGFLAKKSELDAFLYEIYSEASVKISIKTRIGKDSPDEFFELLSIFNQYPYSELIIHPRVQTDYYKNKPNHAIYAEALRVCTNTPCYNGDLFRQEEYHALISEFPEVEKVMIGRGLIMNPGVAGTIKKGEKLQNKELKCFHDRLWENYRVALDGDRNALFKMKEIWFYMGALFPKGDKELKKINKSTLACDYEEAVRKLFKEWDTV